MSERPDLNELRNKLDEIDNSILDLFEERIATCREIGNYKRENGMEVFVPEREAEKLKKVEELAGFESRPYVAELFKTAENCITSFNREHLLNYFMNKEFICIITISNCVCNWSNHTN